MSDDPSQSAGQAAKRQDQAVQEKWRAKVQEGALTGLEERNTKWDVEYEGKDAKGTLVRPFEPGFGDARRLPEKMMGETTAMAVARGMGRALPHSGAGDGKKVFKTEDNPALLKKMLREEQDKDAPPPIPRRPKNIKLQGEQQRRLENQWAVGLYGGSYGMHTRHVTTPPPAHKSETAAAKSPPAPILGWLVEPGPPSPSKSPQLLMKDSSVMTDGEYDNQTAYSRASPMRRAVPPPEEFSSMPATLAGLRSRDKGQFRNEGAHAMMDRMGPNLLSGPIPRDGFTTDIYEEMTRNKLHEV